MASYDALPPFPEDWAQTLVLKRKQGRRIRPETLPPYLTLDGWVLEDRRSHQDRRKTLDSAAPPNTNHADNSLSFRPLSK